MYFKAEFQLPHLIVKYKLIILTDRFKFDMDIDKLFVTCLDISNVPNV